MAVHEFIILSVLCFTFGQPHTVSVNNYFQKPPNPSYNPRDFQLSNQIDEFFGRFEATIERVDSKNQCDFVKAVYQEQIIDVMKEIEKTIPKSEETRLEAVAHFLRFAVTFFEHHFLYCSSSKDGYQSKDVECVTNAYPPESVHDLPWYKMDLSVKPSHRWFDIVEVYKGELTALMDQVVHLVNLIDPSGKIVSFVDEYFPFLLMKLPTQYRWDVLSFFLIFPIYYGTHVYLFHK